MNDDIKDLKSMPDSYWREKLTPEQYHVLREAGTDAPFTGRLLNNHEDGFFHCGACGQRLFASDTKFESGSGWPSFYESLGDAKVDLIDDVSRGMRRIEVRCGNCGSHLGHLFSDGPKEHGGQRFCLNSTSLGFKPDASKLPKSSLDNGNGLGV